MDEKIKARYIDPMVDWSFKRLFGSEVNKDILIEFLKVIFPEHEIEDITYIPAEQLGIMEDDRKAVFDVICRKGRSSLLKCSVRHRNISSRGHCTTLPSRS